VSLRGVRPPGYTAPMKIASATATATATLLLAAAFALTACGNKGPLVLSDPDASEAFDDDGMLDPVDPDPAGDAGDADDDPGAPPPGSGR
jgi:predicted small lipoprotein YifL